MGGGGRGEALVRVGLRGKKEEEKEKWGRERKALYEKEKKRDEGGRGVVGTGKRDEWGVCVEI